MGEGGMWSGFMGRKLRQLLGFKVLGIMKCKYNLVENNLKDKS